MVWRTGVAEHELIGGIRAVCVGEVEDHRAQNWSTLCVRPLQVHVDVVAQVLAQPHNRRDGGVSGVPERPDLIVPRGTADVLVLRPAAAAVKAKDGAEGTKLCAQKTKGQSRRGNGRWEVSIRNAAADGTSAQSTRETSGQSDRHSDTYNAKESAFFNSKSSFLRG